MQVLSGSVATCLCVFTLRLFRAMFGHFGSSVGLSLGPCVVPLCGAKGGSRGFTAENVELDVWNTLVNIVNL